MRKAWEQGYISIYLPNQFRAQTVLRLVHMAVENTLVFGLDPFLAHWNPQRAQCPLERLDQMNSTVRAHC